MKDELISEFNHPFGYADEKLVFSYLLKQKSALKIKEIHQCDGYLADGYLLMEDGRYIGLEIKRTLGFSQLATACFQLCGLQKTKNIRTHEAWIFYEKLADEWIRKKENQNDPLFHAKKLLSTFEVGINFKLNYIGDFLAKSTK
jgi:hypothetical protein